MLQKLIRYRYIIVLALFAVWMGFFDRNNLIEQFTARQKLNKLKEEKAYYLREIEKANKDYQDLFTNDESLEKFAREKYLMKKDNEDIFVIVEVED